jgi:hypothetical protein
MGCAFMRHGGGGNEELKKTTLAGPVIAFRQYSFVPTA